MISVICLLAAVEAHLGLESFVDKFRSGQMSQLGLSLYVLLVLLHPYRPGVAQSWDEDLRRERDRWLAEQLQALSSSRVSEGGQG